MHALIEWFEYQSRVADADGFEDRFAACIELAEGLKQYTDFDLKELCVHLEKARSGSDTLATRCGADPQSQNVVETLILLRDIEGLTVTELKRFLKLTGEPTSGTKTELLEKARRKVPALDRVNYNDYIEAMAKELTPALYQRNATWYPVVLFAAALSGFGPFFSASNHKLLTRLFTGMAYTAERGGLQRYLEIEGRSVDNTVIGLWSRIMEHTSDTEVSTELEQSVRKATVGQLREVAKKVGIDHRGAKKALVDRLIERLEGKAGTSTDAGSPEVADARRKLLAIREKAGNGASKAALERMFAQEIESLPPDVILALGREYRFAETRRKKLLEHFWASIEKTSAQAMRR